MTLPANEQYQPQSAASKARSGGAEKQCRITVTPVASARRISKVSSSASPSVVAPPSRTWMTSGFATRRAISIWVRKAWRCASRGARSR